MRSVLIVGDRVPGGLAVSLGDGFESLGWRVESLPWGPRVPFGLTPVAFRAPVVALPVRRRLLAEARTASSQSKFDLVVVLKGLLLDGRSIEQLGRVFGSPLVCWNPDSPFDHAISNRGGGAARVIGAYDAYVTWSEDVATLLRPYARKVLVVPFGFDPRLHHPVGGDGTLADRVVFVGNWTKDRERWIAGLAPWAPIVFGNGWRPLPGVERRPALDAPAYCRVVAEARWSLNLLRPQNARSHNMRTFEIPACGGRQLANDTPDHRRFLAGSSARLFSTPDELVQRLDGPLPDEPPRPPDFAEHTYAKRVECLLNLLQVGGSS